MPQKTCPAIHILTDMRKKYAPFFDRSSKILEEKINWPSWCYLPMAHSFDYFMEIIHPTMIDTTIPAVLTAVFTWRVTKGIYRFDKDFVTELLNTKSAEHIPVDILLHLPEYCVYVDTASFNIPYIGAFIHLEYDYRFPKIPELRYVLVNEDLAYYVGYIPLVEGTIEDVILKLEENADPNELHIMENADNKQNLITRINLILLITLSLCAPKSIDITSASRTNKKAVNLNIIPSDPVKWDVGIRIGSAIRRYKRAYHDTNIKTGKTIRPHIRAAHWHTYHIGKGKKETVLKWLLPILVKGDDQELPAVIHRVN